MKNIIEVKDLKEILKNTWEIDTEEISNAPRGFVAETFFVKSQKDEFFVKVIDANSRYTENILTSLPVVEAMRDFGILNISQIVKTKEKSLVYSDTCSVVIVFKKIHGESTWKYNRNNYY